MYKESIVSNSDPSLNRDEHISISCEIITVLSRFNCNHFDAEEILERVKNQLKTQTIQAYKG